MTHLPRIDGRLMSIGPLVYLGCSFEDPGFANALLSAHVYRPCDNHLDSLVSPLPLAEDVCLRVGYAGTGACPTLLLDNALSLFSFSTPPIYQVHTADWLGRFLHA